MKCHTNDNSTSFTQLPHKFSYIVAILGHNHFESPNISQHDKIFFSFNSYSSGVIKMPPIFFVPRAP
jgi:hypothetical protein